jgi:hypothetical protein
MEDSGAEYNHWAFISYSHHDKRVARLLKETLARRRVPRSKRRLAGKGSGRLRTGSVDL